MTVRLNDIEKMSNLKNKQEAVADYKTKSNWLLK